MSPAAPAPPRPARSGLERSDPSGAGRQGVHLGAAVRCCAVPGQGRAERSGAGTERERRDGTGRNGLGGSCLRTARGSPRAGTGTRSPGGRGCSGNTEIGVPGGWQGTPGGPGTAGRNAQEAHGCESGRSEHGCTAGIVPRLQVRVAAGGSPWLGGGCQQHPWVRVGSCISLPLAPRPQPPAPAATGTADTPSLAIDLPLLQSSRGDTALAAQHRSSQLEKRARLGEPVLLEQL